MKRYSWILYRLKKAYPEGQPTHFSAKGGAWSMRMVANHMASSRANDRLCSSCQSVVTTPLGQIMTRRGVLTGRGRVNAIDPTLRARMPTWTASGAFTIQVLSRFAIAYLLTKRGVFTPDVTVISIVRPGRPEQDHVVHAVEVTQFGVGFLPEGESSRLVKSEQFSLSRGGNSYKLNAMQPGKWAQDPRNGRWCGKVEGDHRRGCVVIEVVGSPSPIDGPVTVREILHLPMRVSSDIFPINDIISR
ncbi:hypothetical protein B0H19DRAFT_1067008 [Mycena capillaripes]|nr:hypothetical protein B0H19DRAFT_1067008 [Mycena capillaripes]